MEKQSYQAINIVNCSKKCFQKTWSHREQKKVFNKKPAWTFIPSATNM